jgi:ribosomal protein S6
VEGLKKANEAINKNLSTLSVQFSNLNTQSQSLKSEFKCEAPFLSFLIVDKKKKKKKKSLGNQKRFTAAEGR